MRTRHSFGEHVGEVRLRVEAPTLRELFEETGRALAELSADVSHDAAPAAEERVEIAARDRDALLVAWMNELVFRAETRKLVYDDLRVDPVDDTTLRATICGRRPLRVRTAVKAATMHDLRVEEDADGFAASVVLDV